jgi:hypothetical protein
MKPYSQLDFGPRSVCPICERALPELPIMDAPWGPQCQGCHRPAKTNDVAFIVLFAIVFIVVCLLLGCLPKPAPVVEEQGFMTSTGIVKMLTLAEMLESGQSTSAIVEFTSPTGVVRQVIARTISDGITNYVVVTNFVHR